MSCNGPFRGTHPRGEVIKVTVRSNLSDAWGAGGRVVVVVGGGERRDADNKISTRSRHLCTP